MSDPDKRIERLQVAGLVLLALGVPAINVLPDLLGVSVWWCLAAVLLYAASVVLVVGWALRRAKERL